jgi:hypothetical protein
MQIGQILVEQRWVQPSALTRALAEQRHTGKRICSLLIARGLLDADHAARALATQHNVPGVLQRHLENRDRSLAALLPAAVARKALALPIGRTRDHALIVCVREPRPGLHDELVGAVGGAVVIVIAPASQLEALIQETYRGMANATSVPARTGELQLDDGDVEVDLNTRTIPVVTGEMPDLGSMTLVELDDDRVTRDPTQSSQLIAAHGRATTAPLAPRTTGIPATRAPNQALRATTSPLRGTAPKLRSIPAALAPSDLDTALAAIARAAAPDEAIDCAMRYVAQRFRHAVLFAIQDGVALGDRGHGGQLTSEAIQAITIPLTAPSIVQAAHDTGRPQPAAPRQPSVIQDRLARTLGSPQTLAALPVEVDGCVAYVLAVGDSATESGARATTPAALAELERLTGALGDAYSRLGSR